VTVGGARSRPAIAAWVLAGAAAAAPGVARAQGGALPPHLADRAKLCFTCHGENGRSSIVGTPSLAGQPQLFLENRLVLIREGLSPIDAMKGMLDLFDDAELSALAGHFSRLAPPPAAAPRDEARAERGRRLAERALCVSCHLPDHRGREQIPRLAGQREDYLLATMRAMLAGKAPGRDTAMTNALGGLGDRDLSDLAHHLATLASP
jgi:cytochrome c553